MNNNKKIVLQASREITVMASTDDIIKYAFILMHRGQDNLLTPDKAAVLAPFYSWWSNMSEEEQKSLQDLISWQAQDIMSGDYQVNHVKTKQEFVNFCEKENNNYLDYFKSNKPIVKNLTKAVTDSETGEFDFTKTNFVTPNLFKDSAKNTNTTVKESVSFKDMSKKTIDKDVCKDYEKGLPTDRIQAKYNITKHKLYKIIDKYKIQRRGRDLWNFSNR